jgi:hypothetical protein
MSVENWRGRCTHSECGDDDPDNFFFDSGLGDEDEEGDDVVFPEYARKLKLVSKKGYQCFNLLICSETSCSNDNSQRQNATW